MNIVDSATTLSELEKGFNSKLEDLKVLNYIRGGWDKDTVDEILECQKELVSISQRVSVFKEILRNGKKEIEETKRLLPQIDHIHDRLLYMKNNLPNHLPFIQESHEAGKEVPNPDLKSSKQSIKQTTKPSTNKLTIKEDNAPKQQKIQKVLPKVSYITLEEYESVPKYTKGRIPYGKVNTAIDDINKAVEGKYALIKKPRSKLSPIELSLVENYKRQINKETKGFHFVVDEDLKNFTQMKLDPSGRNILTILRTLKRLKEVRGPANLVRYCIL